MFSTISRGHVWHSRLAAYLLVAIATVFLIVSIRPGHGWGGDFALYIAHAKNIATGHQYADTGFVYNPHEPFLSPRSYPPVFPLVLSPVYAVFGLDLHALKVANILIFSVFLLIFYRYTEQRLDYRISRLALLAVVAFSPWYWDAKDTILPDYAFLLFLYSSIILVDRKFKAEKATRPAYSIAVAGGLLVYLAYGTRSVGMFLVPAMMLHDLVRFRTLRKATLLLAAVFSVLYMVQNTWLQTDTSYIDSIESVADDARDNSGHEAGKLTEGLQVDDVGCGKLCLIVKELASRIPRKISYYGQVMNSYWENGFSAALGRMVFVGVGILVIAGFLSQISRGPSLGDFFVVIYFAVLLVVPFQQPRYMLPLVPLYLLYAVSGIERITTGFSTANQLSFRAGGFAIAAFFCIVAISYAGKYSTFNADGMVHGVESSESLEMFDYIRNTTPVDSLFVFHKPRPLALFTGRRSVRYHWELDIDELWNYLTGIGVTHIILPKYIPTSRHNEHFNAMIYQHKDALETIFENRNFVIYLIVGK